MQWDKRQMKSWYNWDEVARVVPDFAGASVYGVQVLKAGRRHLEGKGLLGKSQGRSSCVPLISQNICAVTVGEKLHKRDFSKHSTWEGANADRA